MAHNLEEQLLLAPTPYLGPQRAVQRWQCLGAGCCASCAIAAPELLEAGSISPVRQATASVQQHVLQAACKLLLTCSFLPQACARM